MILAVNIHADEDAQVVPFIRNNKYGFIPLKGGATDWAKSSYDVRATPSNFLIDPLGRVIFKPRVYDEETEQTFALEIEALLK